MRRPRRGLLAAALLLAALLATACAGPGVPVTDALVTDAPPARPVLPGLGSALGPGPVLQANRDIATDLVDLVFERESGLRLPRLLRFEGPVRVELRDLPRIGPDLDALLGRLRAEAGIDIARAARGEAGTILIVGAPRARIREVFPGAQCFVIPARLGWGEFLRALDRGQLPEWDRLQALDGATIFLPDVASPETLRECLEEELAQALGPANDLFRLRDSVFNDDNVHSRLTRFDMLVLRTLYDPRMRSGMTRDEARATAAAVLDAINPDGARIAPRSGLRPAPEWERILRGLFGSGETNAALIAGMLRALRLAERFPQPDHRLATTLDFLAALEFPTRPELAEALLVRALESLERHGNPQGLRAATIRLYLGQVRLRLARPDLALAHVEAALPALAAHDAAAHIAQALAVRTAALEALGRDAEAAASAVDSRAWAEYVRGREPARLFAFRDDQAGP